MAALVEYSATRTDRRQDQLDSYIERLHTGQLSGHVATIKVMYCRKHNLHGRRYARGVAAQSLTKEARLVAFSGGSCVDVDMKHAH